MEIAHFVSNFPINEKAILYGKTMASTNLCLSLSRSGHCVRVFTPSEDRNDYIHNYEGTMVYRYGSILRFRSERISPKILFKPLDYNVDVVHVHSGISIAIIAGFRYAIKKKKPLVITWHGDSIKEYGRYSGLIAGTAANFYKKYLADKILSYADIIISPSEYYIDDSKFLGKYRDKIVVIPNGVNIENFDIQYSKLECKNKLGLNGTNVILFVGGLYDLKGPHILLKAIPKIVKVHKNTIFIFAGSGDIDKYKKISKNLGVEKYVRFTGYINDIKSIYYRAADVFILPSYEEMFPMVLLEASASGVPIIASDLNSLKCIIDNGYNGLFAKKGNENDFTESIIYLLNNEDVREKMGKNANNKVQRFSWPKIAEQTEKLYTKIISQNNDSKL